MWTLSIATYNTASTSIILEFQIQLSCLSHYLTWDFYKDYFESVDLFNSIDI